jgi:hypothetical protein
VLEANEVQVVYESQKGLKTEETKSSVNEYEKDSEDDFYNYLNFGENKIFDFKTLLNITDNLDFKFAF